MRLRKFVQLLVVVVTVTLLGAACATDDTAQEDAAAALAEAGGARSDAAAAMAEAGGARSDAAAAMAEASGARSDATAGAAGANAANAAAEAATAEAAAALAAADAAQAAANVALATAEGNLSLVADAKAALAEARAAAEAASSEAGLAREEAAAAQAEAASAQEEAAAARAEAAAAQAEAAAAQAEADAALAAVEAIGPSEAPGGPFTLMVSGTGYAMPGPAGGILGGLPPDEVFPWTYNFGTATYEAGGEPAAPFDPSIRTASQDYEIAWVSGWAALEFSQYIANSIESTAAASGVHVGAICDSEFDPEKALACAETVAESDPDAVIFGNWRSEAAESSMEVFDDVGIPVITIDVWHPNAIFFGANNYVSGAVAGVNTGLYALETWNCRGVHVLLAQNLTAGEAPDLRTSGFADGVQAVCGSNVPVSRIDVDGSPENGFVSTTDWLTGNPGAEHVLATSLDDVVAVPMSRAMEQAGRSGVAAGHGSEPNGVERLNEGPASETRYLGSVAYFPELYGVYAVAALIDILDGRAVPQEIHIDHVWVTRDNVDLYYDPEGQPIHNLGP